MVIDHGQYVGKVQAEVLYHCQANNPPLSSLSSFGFTLGLIPKLARE
jgi:hypothetical protein